MQAGGVLVGRELPGLFDRELRAEPVGIVVVAVQQHAEFVDAVDDFVLIEDVVLFLHLRGAAEHFMQRQHGIVGRMVGVMAGRPIDRRARRVPHREVVGDRDRLVVGDEEAILRAAGRAPRAHARVGAGLHQIDGGAAAGLMGMRILGHPFFMGAPAEFGRLHAFRQETFHRPGVDEDV